LAWRIVWKRWPCNRSTFNEPNSDSAHALTLLCQEAWPEEAKSSKMRGYTSLTR
jgi:hypothetical protein